MKIKILLFLNVVIILFSVYYFYLKDNYIYKVNKIAKDDNSLGIEKWEGELGVKDKDINKDDLDAQLMEKLEAEGIDFNQIKMFALFGLDRREFEEESNSDSIIIAMMNYKTKEIKLVSVMRDVLVDIEGYGKHKINHAYLVGGPELAIKTLNQNFGLKIKDYVAVDFRMLEHIIDEVGGLDVELKQEELTPINKYAKQVADKEKEKYEPLVDEGLQHLTGRQAVAYARIRSVGNGDFDRTIRQQFVVTELAKKLKVLPLHKVPSIAKEVMPNTESSIEILDAMRLGKDYILHDFKEIETARLPFDNFTLDMYNNMSVIKIDHDEQRRKINEFLLIKKP